MMTMKRFEAVIFDMDGVIVDSEPLHERAFREVLEEIGYGRTHGIDFPAYYGKSDLVVWRDFIARRSHSKNYWRGRRKNWVRCFRRSNPYSAACRSCW